MMTIMIPVYAPASKISPTSSQLVNKVTMNIAVIEDNFLIRFEIKKVYRLIIHLFYGIVCF